MSTQRTAWKKVWIWMNCEYERYYYFIISEPNKTKTRVTYNGGDRVSKHTFYFCSVVG